MAERKKATIHETEWDLLDALWTDRVLVPRSLSLSAAHAPCVM